MDGHRQIEDQAAALLAKRDSGDWGDVDQACLTQWIEESIAHRVAFLRLEAAWEEARRLKALCAGLQPGTVPPPGEWRHSPFFDSTPEGEKPSRSRGNVESPSRSLKRPLFAAAASLLLALGIGTYLALVPAGNRYSTPIGGVASVPLQDGSNITLNTASEVRVALTPKERRIELDKGEAYFEVAHDASRPFIVQVGNKRVVAVGTKFSVRRDGEDIRVTVTEGKVRLENASSPHHEVPREDGSADVFVAAGSVASADDSGILVRAKSLAEVDDDLSWRQGYLTFHETALADAVAEFNRYNRHKISIEDPQVAAIRISGTFRPTNYEAFVRLLQDGFSIHATNSEEETSLTK